MRKFILMVLTAVGFMLAAPQTGSAAPIGPSGLGAAADQVGGAEPIQYWHYRRYRPYRAYRVYRYRPVHCWHRRYSSGRRCAW
jgi:hypothetical protein